MPVKLKRRRPDTALILVARVGHVHWLPPGAQTGDCGRCGAPVWVSMLALDVAARARLRPRLLCDACVAGAEVRRPIRTGEARP